jgi:cytoskeleton protein RodZ
LSATAGSLLKEAREARGLSLEEVAAATRVRVPYLEALEADALNRLPALVYARGYLRTYAQLLDLEAEPLVASLRPAREPERTPAAASRRTAWRPTVSPGLVVAAGAVLVAAVFALYARHEISLQYAGAAPPAPVLIATPPAASPAAAPAALAGSAVAATGAASSAEPAPGHAASIASQVTVSLHFLDQVWVYVVVDGSPVYGANGRFFGAGDQATFSGADVSVTSGKGAATIVSVNGRTVGALPDGVTTKDFTAQT